MIFIFKKNLVEQNFVKYWEPLLEWIHKDLPPSHNLATFLHDNQSKSETKFLCGV